MADSQGHDRSVNPLLETKLFAPKWRPTLVRRRRLIERLDRGVDRKLTLISAPAGFGKTTLVSEWLSTGLVSQQETGWVSLDERDNDPALFWAYFIAALRTIRVDVGKNALLLLHSPNRSSIETALTTLINEINVIEQDFTLVLDDYHCIDDEQIQNAVAFLIDHLPPQMHLTLLSRAEPSLPLSLLRGRGELNELRSNDLRFTSDEAAAFLKDAMGLALSAEDLDGLESRTEGWIAGLQLAALSMQGRDDVSEFIKAFAGHNRYIVDYLAAEVLQLQTDEVRNFLSQTSILDRLSGPLCDAVTGLKNTREMLERLERGNFFVVALDDKREWYRYHHLLSDVLRARLIEEDPDLVPTLHERASEWYEQNDYSPNAIRHSLTAKNFEKAADLIELAWRSVRQSNEEETWMGWLNSLPESVIESRPVLTLGHAWILLFTGEFEAGSARLRTTERLLQMADSSEGLTNIHVADEAMFRSLPGAIASARAFYSQVLEIRPQLRCMPSARWIFCLKTTTSSELFRRRWLDLLNGRTGTWTQHMSRWSMAWSTCVNQGTILPRLAECWCSVKYGLRRAKSATLLQYTTGQFDQ